jgi:Spy/CpxP family protein refolding chaperone
MMRRLAHVALRLTILGVLVGSPVVASAQAPSAQTADARQRRDKIKQRIRALRAYTLTEQLELDEATAGKLFPVLAKYDEEFDRLLLARADLQRRLSGASSADAKATDKLIDEATANQRAIWDTEVRRLDQLRKILTPKQVAKLLVVLPAMERKLQAELRKVVGKAPRADAKPAPAAGSGAVPDDKMPGPTDVIDPFDRSKTSKRSGTGVRDTTQLEDPFADEPRPKKRPSGAKTQPSGFCDPFASQKGCK